MNRHEVLRTVLEETEGKAWQGILAKDQWHLTEAEVTDEKTLPGLIEGIIATPFDLSKDYMLRVHLLRISEEAHILVVVMHHVASDGWSLGVFVEELMELYRSGVEGRSPHLPELPVQYADYALWQRHYLEGAVLEQKLDYWETQLKGVSTLDLPTAFPRPEIQSSRGATLYFDLDRALSKSVQDLCIQEGTTLFMTLLAAFKVLLYRHSGQSAICVSPIANRTQKELEPLLGYFSNMLALRTDMSEAASMTFRDLLAEVKNTTLDAYAHQEVPFEQIINQVESLKDMTYNSLLRAVFAMRNTPEVPDFQLNGLQLYPEAFERKTTKFDLTFVASEQADSLNITVQYCTDLFLPATINCIVTHYQLLLSVVLSNPGQSVEELVASIPVEEKECHEIH